jgi:aminoglycoside phosphotransferase (APT) family kinase protein
MRLDLPLSATTLAWVSEQTGGAAIHAAEFLTRGGSHSNHAITLDARGGRRVVLRRWLRPDWRERDPDHTVEREVAALVLLERADFAAPRLIAADPQGEHCGVPALLMTCVPGRPPSRRSVAAARSLEQLAAAALALHRIPAPWPGIPGYRPYNDLRDPRPPRHSTRPDLWERAFAIVAAAPPPQREALIHRDYHPGNTLWLDGRLSGVVDWTTASRGPAGVDIGHMRWNLALDHGEQAAEAFLGCCRAIRDGSDEHQPYWDLRCVVDLLPEEEPDDGLTAAQLARLEPYLTRVLAQC